MSDNCWTCDRPKATMDEYNAFAAQWPDVTTHDAVMAWHEYRPDLCFAHLPDEPGGSARDDCAVDWRSEALRLREERDAALRETEALRSCLAWEEARK